MEKRAVVQHPTARFYPIVDTGNLREILDRNIPAIAPCSVIQRYRNVL